MAPPLRLSVVICSTRPGRAGLPIGTWFFERAKAHAGFESELLDLKEVNLPFLDEPGHPRLGKYEFPHSKAWSAKVAAADAFVFVTPEYNFSAPPTLLNAIDYLSAEWAYKPAAFVSYGGVSAGTRSVQMSKLVLTAVKMMPIPEAVAVPMFTQHLNKETGQFTPPEPQLKAADGMLAELHRWATALKPMRG